MIMANIKMGLIDVLAWSHFSELKITKILKTDWWRLERVSCHGNMIWKTLILQFANFCVFLRLFSEHRQCLEFRDRI